MSTESLTVIPPSQLGFESGTSTDRSMIETAVSRQAQEVQAAMVIAKKFPRDQTAAYLRIINSCKRPGLAAESQYSFPRGGQNITGPTIRLAEVLAQNWGNLDFGVVELEQKLGESIVMAYCWDLETNTRQAKVFTVKHERSKRSGNEILTDPRDIYELVANNGARRLRACILGIIPGDVVEDAIAQCEETLRLKDQAEGPLIDRVRKLAARFQEKFQVTPAMMEARIGRKAESFTEIDYSTLRKIFIGLRDGLAKKEDFFAPESPVAPIFNTPAAETARAKPSKEKAKEPEIIPPDARATPLQGVRNLLTTSKVSEATLEAYLFASGMTSEGTKLDAVDDAVLTQVIEFFPSVVGELQKGAAR